MHLSDLWGDGNYFSGAVISQLGSRGNRVRNAPPPGEPVRSRRPRSRTGLRALWYSSIGKKWATALVLHVTAAAQLSGRDRRARPIGYANGQRDRATFATRTLRYGCTNSGECVASCPKEIPIFSIVNLNREFLRAVRKGPR